MPDKLVFTEKLPLAWLHTSMYTKAAKALYKHKDTRRYIYASSSDRFLVLTSAGEETYGKITESLVKRYCAEVSQHIAYPIASFTSSVS